jgi:hypothetical protein
MQQNIKLFDPVLISQISLGRTRIILSGRLIGKIGYLDAEGALLFLLIVHS